MLEEIKRDLQELANKEDDLYIKVKELAHHPQTDVSRKKLQEIFLEYKKIHQTYASLSLHNIEALKRGLFIQWYAIAEPSFLTGISDLDEEAETQILRRLDQLKVNEIEEELSWMLNYYSNWKWIFEINKTFTGFNKNIVNDQNNKLPETIDREAMKKRGGMGRYWNSLKVFQNK
ncbi:MAG: hypothetical protein ACTHJ5_09310 [Ilyomonas sp.]